MYDGFYLGNLGIVYVYTIFQKRATDCSTHLYILIKKSQTEENVMRFTIKESDLLVINDEKVVAAYSKYVKNILRNKTNVILELTKQENSYEVNFYENNLPASYFGPIFFPSKDPDEIGEVHYVELTPKALALLVPEANETTFELKERFMIIKQGPLTIRDSYESSKEEVKAKLASYSDLFENKEGEVITLNKESPLTLTLAVLSSNPDAHIDILDGFLTYSQGTFLHRSPTEIEGDYFINSYLATKIVNILGYCERVELWKSNTITLKGYINEGDTDPIVLNISPVYEREDEPYSDEEIEANKPKDAEEISVPFEELISTFDIAKAKIRSFLDKDANLCTFTKNGNGATFKLSTGDEDVGITDIAINIGQIDPELDENKLDADAYVGYKINIPLSYLKQTQFGVSTLKILHDDNDITAVELRLDNLKEGEVMLVGKE